jgi:hypothetical protein
MSQLPPRSRSRFGLALAAYAILGGLTWFTLDGRVRIFILILLAGLAVKTWVDVRRRELE